MIQLWSVDIKTDINYNQGKYIALFKVDENRRSRSVCNRRRRGIYLLNLFVTCKLGFRKKGMLREDARILGQIDEKGASGASKG